MICPTCNGEKKFVTLCAYNGETMRGGPAIIPCINCHETGEVDDRYWEWKKIGGKLKDARIARAETLRAFCNRTGVDPDLRSRQERGFADPTGVSQ